MVAEEEEEEEEVEEGEEGEEKEEEMEESEEEGMEEEGVVEVDVEEVDDDGVEEEEEEEFVEDVVVDDEVVDDVFKESGFVNDSKSLSFISSSTVSGGSTRFMMPEHASMDSGRAMGRYFGVMGQKKMEVWQFSTERSLDMLKMNDFSMSMGDFFFLEICSVVSGTTMNEMCDCVHCRARFPTSSSLASGTSHSGKKTRTWEGKKRGEQPDRVKIWIFSFQIDVV